MHLTEGMCMLYSEGLMFVESHDAIKEGDGYRILHCWCYLSYKTNYSFVTHFYLILQDKLLTYYGVEL